MRAADLIERLRAVDPDTVVIIEDADTGWPLRLFAAGPGVGTWSKAFVLGAGYHDELDEDKWRPEPEPPSPAPPPREPCARHQLIPANGPKGFYLYQCTECYGLFQVKP